MKLFLLISYFMCCYLKIIDSDEQGLVFVFDTTKSMSDDLENFKKGADLILDTMVANSNSPISNYVLVPFNDPKVGPVFSSKFENDLRAAIRNLNISEKFNPDCPEMSFSGLKLALESTSDNSNIFVLTDATEKDSHLLDDLINLLQRRRSQVKVIFLLTGGCSGFTFENYEKIAAASSGQVFYLNKAIDIFQVLKYINKTLDSDTIDMNYAINSKGYREEKVMVDESIKSVSIIISGGKPQLEVFNPRNETIDDPKLIEKTLDLSKVKILKILQPTVGEWTVKYGSDEQHTLKITGVSEIKFKHGFSVTGTSFMSETTNRPLLGANNCILVSVIQGADHVDKLLSLKIVDFSEKTLFQLDLLLFKPNLYRTKNFQPNHELFYIVIIGVDKKGNAIQRTSKTAIQVQKPEKPYIALDKEGITNMHKTINLICHIESLVPIEVTWYKNWVKLQSWNFNQSGKAVYQIKKLNQSNEGEYQCEASNTEGSVSKTIRVTVKETSPEIWKICIDPKYCPISFSAFLFCIFITLLFILFLVKCIK